MQCKNCLFHSFWCLESRESCLLCLQDKKGKKLLDGPSKERVVNGIGGWKMFNKIPDNLPEPFWNQILMDMPLYFWTETPGRYFELKVIPN
jgi:hypothetical protein